MTSRQNALAIKENLAQHVSCTETLLKILAEEKAALLGSDVDSLTRLCEAKSSAALTLQSLSARLNKACGSNDARQVEAHIRATGETESIGRWEELLRLAARCQQANLENGALLLERQTRVRSMLQVLQRGEKPLYDRGGSSPLAASRRALASA